MDGESSLHRREVWSWSILQEFLLPPHPLLTLPAAPGGTDDKGLCRRRESDLGANSSSSP